MAALTPEQGAARFLRHVAIERGLSQNTRDAYQRDLGAYAAWLAEQSITDLTLVEPETLAEFVMHMSGATGAQPLAAGTIARRLSTVRGMHRFLFEEGALPSYAGSGVRTPKKGRQLPKALALQQVEAILDAPPIDTAVGLRDRALLELLYATGARVSEVTALDLDDLLAEHHRGDAWVDPEAILGDGGFLRVLGKGSKQRIVPYGSYAGRALAAYLVRARPALVAKGTGTPALFVGPRGGRVSRQGVWLIIRAAAERADIHHEVSPHTMRHSFATHLLAGGADVRSVQELLGHASVETTQIYTQVTADTLREHYLQAHPRAK
ncbi:MAG: site-specific tyrosine recombinase XerD [Leucobacter sp.]|nr:site-specific tyrosine recombinase XerD [Leucobacter sp.]